MNVAELSSRLAVCPRRTQQVINYLCDSGYPIQTRWNRGRKQLYLPYASNNALANVLNPNEQKMLQALMDRSEKRVEQVILKLIKAAANPHQPIS